MWSPVLGRLAPERECWALDLPGFGRSRGLRDAAPTPAALADAVVGFMAGQGVESFHVAGNSLGGGVALEIARQGAARTACAISPVGFAQGLEVAFLDRSLRLTRRTAELALGRLDGRRLPGPARRLLAAQMVFRGERMPSEDLVATLRDLALAPGFQPTLPHLLAYRFSDGDLPCRTTIAWGEHDRLNLFAPQSARARERVPGARHVTLAGCGHIPTWDDPAQVARLVLDASADTGDRDRTPR